MRVADSHSLRTEGEKMKILRRLESMNSPVRHFRMLITLLVSFSAVWVWAQQPANPSGSSCLSKVIVSVPSRPTVSNATDTTQCGAVELEYGWERQWVSTGTHQGEGRWAAARRIKILH